MKVYLAHNKDNTQYGIYSDGFGADNWCYTHEANYDESVKEIDIDDGIFLDIFEVIKKQKDE